MQLAAMPPRSKPPIAPPPKVTSSAQVAAIESIDWRTRINGHTPFSAILAQAQVRPEATAIIDLIERGGELGAHAISYDEFADRLARTANVFVDLAGRAPPVVAIIAPSRPDALACLWAASAYGCAVPINPFLRLDHIRGILEAAGANIVVLSSRYLAAETYAGLVALGEAPGGPTVLCLDQRHGPQSYSGRLEAASASFDLGQLAGSDDVTALFHTGGTTALPKLVQHTGGQQLLNAWCAEALYADGERPVVAHGMPNFHVGGAIISALRALTFGHTLLNLTPAGFRSAVVVGRFWGLAEDFGVTSMVATPTTFGALLEAAPTRIAKPMDMVSGGSGLPLALAQQFRVRLGLTLRQMWGMTEGHGVLTFQRPEHVVAGAVGPPIPYHAVELDPREVVLVRGPCVTNGYHGGGDEDVIVAVDGVRRLVTGDIGRIGEDGELFILGRAKDVIIRGGHNLDPVVIEEAANQHPAVLYAAAVGMPDAQKGELPLLFVQLKPNAAVAASELCRFCSERIPERAAAPVEVRFIAEMPLTAVGKIFKPALRSRLVSETVAAELARALPDVRYELSAGDHGSIAVRLADPLTSSSDAERIRAVLQRFTFPFEVVV